MHDHAPTGVRQLQGPDDEYLVALASTDRAPGKGVEGSQRRELPSQLRVHHLEHAHRAGQIAQAMLAEVDGTDPWESASPIGGERTERTLDDVALGVNYRERFGITLDTDALARLRSVVGLS